MVRKKAGQTGQGRSLQPAWSDRVWRRGRQARQVEACSLLGVIEPEGGEVRLENYETNNMKDFFRQAKEENVRCCRCADDLRER